MIILRIFGYTILTAFIFVTGFAIGAIGALAAVEVFD